jgi:hypothetical protein
LRNSTDNSGLNIGPAGTSRNFSITSEKEINIYRVYYSDDLINFLKKQKNPQNTNFLNKKY